jgi:hypothetical protein
MNVDWQRTHSKIIRGKGQGRSGSHGALVFELRTFEELWYFLICFQGFLQAHMFHNEIDKYNSDNFYLTFYFSPRLCS